MPKKLRKKVRPTPDAILADINKAVQGVFERCYVLPDHAIIAGIEYVKRGRKLIQVERPG